MSATRLELHGQFAAEEKLESALDEGLVSGAGLDVTLPEPPAPDSAFMRVARHPNVIATPHVPWAATSRCRPWPLS